jgi:site-specific recombinase XerD
MILYKRHKKDCQYRQGSGKDKNQSHRCKCSVWVEWNTNGKQRRHPVRDAAGQSTSSWSEAEKLAGRNTETTGNPAVAPKGQDSITVEKAIKLFLESKQGEDLADNTLVKHKLTLRRLQEYCDGEGIALLADVTLPTLASWRAGWTYKSPIAKRNNQERVRAFFRFCLDGELISKNPAKKLTKIQVKDNETGNVNPLEPKQYNAILKAVDLVPEMTATQTARVKALMQLQRWSGLALVDAVCLSKDELVHSGDNCRVVTERRKTGTHINNVIPGWLGEELLTVKNGNHEYFFWTGRSTTKSAVSYFDKLYRKVFEKAGIATNGKLSHRFRHTFAVELLKAGVDIRKVSKALGHSSVTITERYYAKWNKAQQDLLDADLSAAWGKR